MSQYTLYVHSWDIGSGTRGGNHTGFRNAFTQLIIF